MAISKHLSLCLLVHRQQLKVSRPKSCERQEQRSFLPTRTTSCYDPALNLLPILGDCINSCLGMAQSSPIAAAFRYSVYDICASKVPVSLAGCLFTVYRLEVSRLVNPR